MKRSARFGHLLWVAFAVLLALAVAFSGFSLEASNTYAQADKQSSSLNRKHFMVYYRAWRDKTMKGVNTSLPDENWLTMLDIPYGVDVVNVFSYVPVGQEEQAKPFYDALKSTYAPELHRRGVRLVRGVGYSTIAAVPHAGAEPTEQEYENYAAYLVKTLSTDVGLDGLDIDMEEYPNDQQVKLSDGVIKAMSRLIGPQSGNRQSIFLYDTNGSYLNPFKNVENCFDFLAYQQYGSDSTRTARAVNAYQGQLPADRFVPGLTFPEEQDGNNRWLDASEPYTQSNIYEVASYVQQNNLGGMFLYAFDRDGRTYEPDDLNHIKPSNLLWTKTAIAQVNGMELGEAKSLAHHFVDRMKYVKSNITEVSAAIDAGTNLYEVNKAVLGSDYGTGYDPTYDPILESELTQVDISEVERSIDRADTLINALSHGGSYDPSRVSALKSARDNAARAIGGKTYTVQGVAGVASNLIESLKTFDVSNLPANPAQNPSSVPRPREKDSLAATGFDAASCIEFTAAVCCAAGILLEMAKKRSSATRA